MSGFKSSRILSRRNTPEIDDRKITKTALQSLRDYRRARYASRVMPSQRIAAA